MKLKTVMLSVANTPIMLSVFMLNVVMLSIVAPAGKASQFLPICKLQKMDIFSRKWQRKKSFIR